MFYLNSHIKSVPFFPEPVVRGEMMEHLPHIIMVCHELGLASLATIVDRLVPSVVATVTDSDNQVSILQSK